MDYKGTAIKITPQDVTDIATRFNVPEASLRAVMSVETNGHGYDAAGRPEILFERHKFFHNTSGAQHDRAVEEGLAYPRWGEKPYPRSPDLRWEEFLRAAAINETAAIMSTSWGLGQIMGSEFSEARYTSPQEMVTGFCVSEVNQVVGMCCLIAHRMLDEDLRNFPDANACAHFALRYNGTGYRKNAYDTKLATAFHHFNTTPTAATAVSAKIPAVDDDRRKRIMELQRQLKAGGADPGAIDGVMGKQTVMAFQQAQKLTVDGIIGEVTRPLLERALASMEVS